MDFGSILHSAVDFLQSSLIHFTECASYESDKLCLKMFTANTQFYNMSRMKSDNRQLNFKISRHVKYIKMRLSVIIYNYGG
jgi:hypothetical protein